MSKPILERNGSSCDGSGSGSGGARTTSTTYPSTSTHPCYYNGSKPVKVYHRSKLGLSSSSSSSLLGSSSPPGGAPTAPTAPSPHPPHPQPSFHTKGKGTLRTSEQCTTLLQGHKTRHHKYKTAGAGTQAPLPPPPTSSPTKSRAYWRLGSLGPVHIETPEWKVQRERRVRQQEFGKKANQLNMNRAPVEIVSDAPTPTTMPNTEYFDATTTAMYIRALHKDICIVLSLL